MNAAPSWDGPAKSGRRELDGRIEFRESRKDSRPLRDLLANVAPSSTCVTLSSVVERVADLSRRAGRRAAGRRTAAATEWRGALGAPRTRRAQREIRTKYRPARSAHKPEIINSLDDVAQWARVAQWLARDGPASVEGARARLDIWRLGREARHESGPQWAASRWRRPADAPAHFLVRAQSLAPVQRITF